MTLTVILGGCAGLSGRHQFEICRVKALEVQSDNVHHENYVAVCSDDAGREGPIAFAEKVEVGQVVSFTPYQVDGETGTYHGYIHHP